MFLYSVSMNSVIGAYGAANHFFQQAKDEGFGIIGIDYNDATDASPAGHWMAFVKASENKLFGKDSSEKSVDLRTIIQSTSHTK